MKFYVSYLRRFVAVPFIFLLVIISACAPVGYGDVGFTYVNWPQQDQQLPPSALVEVETLLVRLGYLSGQPDGAITTATRAAVKRFQSDIGAPPNGFISPTLLTALRVNAGLGAEIVIVNQNAAGGVVTRPDDDDDDSGDRGGGDGGFGGWE